MGLFIGSRRRSALQRGLQDRSQRSHIRSGPIPQFCRSPFAALLDGHERPPGEFRGGTLRLLASGRDGYYSNFGQFDELGGGCGQLHEMGGLIQPPAASFNSLGVNWRRVSFFSTSLRGWACSAWSWLAVFTGVLLLDGDGGSLVSGHA